MHDLAVALHACGAALVRSAAPATRHSRDLSVHAQHLHVADVYTCVAACDVRARALQDTSNLLALWGQYTDPGSDSLSLGE